LIVNFVPTTSLCQFHFCKTIPTFKKTKTMKLFTATAVCMAMLLACNNDKAKAPETKVAAATTDKPSESATVVLPDPAAMEKHLGRRCNGFYEPLGTAAVKGYNGQ
jgi:hypothetical protein